MSTKTAQCVFCGKCRERAKEHIFSEWLVDCLNMQSDKYLYTHVSVSNVRVSGRMNQIRSLVLGNVCHKCNTGWMNELIEKPAKRAVTKVTTNAKEKMDLSRKESNAIAIWAYKTALVINASANYRRIIPLEHFRYLHDHMRIPGGVVVDIGLTHEKSMASRQSQEWMCITGRKSTDRYLEAQKKSYKISLQVGRILLRICYWPMLHHVINDESNKSWWRIWPNISKLTIDYQSVYKNIDEMDCSALVEHSSRA